MNSLQRIKDASAWEPADLLANDDWIYRLTDADIDEINAALNICSSRISDLTDINQSNFPLVEVGKKLNWVADYIENNRGVAVLKGLPVNNYSKKELQIIYIGMGTYIGAPLKQSTQGEVIQDVYDKGENLYANTGRGTNSSNRLPWHTDRCDVVSLLCLNKAAEGGESKLASLTNVYNKILEEHPDYAAALCQPFYHGRAPFEPEDVRQWYALPVFTQFNGKFASRYLRRFIEIGQDYAEVPRFRDVQVEALNYLDARLNDPDVCLDLPFDVGDIQFLNNFVICHSRNEYRDSPQESRFLFRLWLAAYNGRDLDPAFEPLYGVTAGGQLRGGIWF
ncbi:MAG: TauD/TfdA family dioxygenase [Pseudomonadales bacterium]|nr:TauD/TfdA family dioxygenase [Pseudomonadales bacterium]